MFTKSFRTSITALTILGFLFFIVSPLTVSAQNWTPPSGPPPNNNAPAPIHKGITGQGKYWGNFVNYSIGAFLLFAEGLLSEWSIADNQGVAATQFCLGTTGEIDSSGFPSGIGELECVTADDGWGGGGGGGEGETLPDGSAWNQMLWWDLVTSSWLPLSGVKIESTPTLATLSLGKQTDPNIPDARIYVEGGDLGGFQVKASNNSLFSVNANSIKIRGGDLEGVELKLNNLGAEPIGAVPITTNNSGKLAWISADELGGGLPNGTATGQILYWSVPLGEWTLSSPNGTGYFPAMANSPAGFSVNYASGSRFKYLDTNDDCPKYQVIISKLAQQGFKNLDCTNELRVDHVLSKVYVKSLEHDFDSRVVCAGPEGDLNLCGNLSTGTWSQDDSGAYDFEVPFGVYELTVTLKGGGGGGGAGGMGRSLNLIAPFSIQDDVIGGGGGGGGGGRAQTITETVNVEPGQIYTVTVGEGGMGGCPERRSILGYGGLCETYYGNNFMWNEYIHPRGLNGEETVFTCSNDDCNQEVSLEADRGLGGHGGGTLWGWYENEPYDEWLEFLTDVNVMGGARGQNANGPHTAENGNFGTFMSQPPYVGILGFFNNGANCYYVTAPGGQGGNGSDGAVGGNGGPQQSNGVSCGTWYMSGGTGQSGQSGIGNGRGGAGGGGGNSQSPNNYANGSGPYGYGGFGGRGSDGSISIEW